LPWYVQQARERLLLGWQGRSVSGSDGDRLVAASDWRIGAASTHRPDARF